MRVMILEKQQNLKLLRLLQQYYIREEYFYKLSYFLNQIYGDLTGQYDQFNHQRFTESVNCRQFSSFVMFVMDKVILDNLFRYLHSNQIHQFIFGINNQSLAMDFYVNPFYSSQVMGEFSKLGINYSEDDDYEINEMVSRLIYGLLIDVSKHHTNEINESFLELISMFQDTCFGIPISQYKFELDANYNPMLLYTQCEEVSSQNFQFQSSSLARACL